MHYLVLVLNLECDIKFATPHPGGDVKNILTLDLFDPHQCIHVRVLHHENSPCNKHPFHPTFI